MKNAPDRKIRGIFYAGEEPCESGLARDDVRPANIDID